MGVSRSGAELAGKLTRSASNLKAAEKPAVQAGGKAAERVFLTTAESMHGLGKHVRVTVRQTDSNGHPAVSVKYGPPGWVRIMEGPVQPHFIAKRGGGSLRRQNLTTGLGRKSSRAGRLLLGSLSGGPVQGAGKGPISIPGVGPRMYAKHPGYGLKKPFVKVAQAAAPPLAAAEMRKVQLAEFAKSFK